MNSIKIAKRYFKKSAASSFAAKLRKELKNECPKREFKVEVAQAFQYPAIKKELGAPIDGDFIVVTIFFEAKPAVEEEVEKPTPAKVIKMKPAVMPLKAKKVKYILEEIHYRCYSPIELARVYNNYLLSAA